MPAPPPLHRLLRSPKIAGELIVVLAGIAAIVGGGVSYAHHAAAVRQATALRLRTNGIGIGITVTVTVSPSPVPTRFPPPVTPTVTPTGQPSHAPVRPKAASPPVIVDNGVGVDAGGLFFILPGADILYPAPVSPADPAQVSCLTADLMIAPGAQGMQTCHISSENGFSGTLAISCEHFVGAQLTPEIATDCSVPATVNLPANGVATVNAVFALPGSATDNDYFFIRLTNGGKQIQAPNEWEVIVQLPPQPAPQVSVTCALVPPPIPNVAVGQCQVESTQGSVKPVNPGMFFDAPQPPVGVAAPTDPTLAECWGVSEADAVQAADGTGTCERIAPIPEESTTGPDLSATYWFTIPLARLAAGEWQLPVRTEVGPTTVISTVTFVLAADGSISWS